MATVKSTFYSDQEDGTFLLKSSREFSGRIRIIKFTYTPAATLNAADSVLLCWLPSNAILLPISFCQIDALGTSRTLTLGYAAHTDLTDGSTVAQDTDYFTASTDVSSAATLNMNKFGQGYTSPGEVPIVAVLGGGTWTTDKNMYVNIHYVVD